MTKTNMDLSELLAKHDQGDLLRSIAEAARKRDRSRSRKKSWLKSRHSTALKKTCVVRQPTNAALHGRNAQNPSSTPSRSGAPIAEGHKQNDINKLLPWNYPKHV